LTRLTSILRVPVDLLEGVITSIPGGTGVALRRIYWRRRLRRMGNRVRIETGVRIMNPQCVSLGHDVCIDVGAVLLAGRASIDRPSQHRTPEEAALPEPRELVIGNNTHIAQGVLISARGGGVSIGADTTIAAGSKIYSNVNHFRSKADPSDRRVAFTHLVPSDRQFMVAGPVVLEDNCGVAVQVVILPGTLLRRDSFVSIGSVVRGGEFTENSLIEGNPARRAGDRYA